MKFDMSAAWRDATAMMAGNREVLLVVAGLFFFLPSVIMGFVMGDMEELAMANPENAANLMLSIYANYWWVILLISIASVIGYLALLALLRDHSRPTVADAIKIGFAGLLPAIGAYLILGFGIGVLMGLLLAIASATGSPPLAAAVILLVSLVSVYVGVKVSLAGPVIAIDKVRNPLNVLTRSWALTKGNTFRLALFFLLLVIVYIVVAAIVGMIVGALTLALGPSIGLTINAIVSGAISAVVSVVFVAVIAAAHRQLSGPSAAAVSQTFE